jgi:hypothetical protein
MFRWFLSRTKQKRKHHETDEAWCWLASFFTKVAAIDWLLRKPSFDLEPWRNSVEEELVSLHALLADEVDGISRAFPEVREGLGDQLAKVEKAFNSRKEDDMKQELHSLALMLSILTKLGSDLREIERSVA